MGSKPVNISASRGAAILGLNKYQTQFEVWQVIKEEVKPGFNSLMGYVMPAEPDNAAIRWGRAFENAVIELAESAMNCKIIEREKFFATNGKEFSNTSHIRSNNHYITCHIDGCYANYTFVDGNPVFKSSTVRIHEGKTTSIMSFQKKWGDPGSDKIPQEYQVQIQHQMACTGAESCIVSVLVFPRSQEEFEKDGLQITGPDSEGYKIINKDLTINHYCYEWAQPLAEMGFFHQYTVMRNNELIDIMLEKYAQFWEECIIGDKIPEPVNIDDIKRLAPEPKGTIILPDEISNLYSEYKMINDELGSGGMMVKRKEGLKVSILDAARKLNPVIDTESIDKWVFYDKSGRKLGSYGKTKAGVYVFR
jgi:hypothetical protein